MRLLGGVDPKLCHIAFLPEYKRLTEKGKAVRRNFSKKHLDLLSYRWHASHMMCGIYPLFSKGVKDASIE